MNWQKWIRPGLVVTIVAAPLAVLLEKGAIEHDLTVRVQSALAASGQTWATVSASVQIVSLSGVAPAPDAQLSAVRAATSVPGVQTVVDRTSLPPVVSPYVWSARVAGKQVTFTGSVPSDGARASILAAARRALPQAEIVDRTSFARGAPPAFAAATSFAVGRLPGLSDGLITLTDASLSVSGTAIDGPAYDAFESALAKDAPTAINVGTIDVLPARAARFVWSINLDNASVTLAGDVPNAAIRTALDAAIKVAEPNLPVVDGAAFASGDPPGFAEAASFAVTALQHLQRGGITLDGLSLDIAGVAKSVDDYDALLASLSGNLPDGVKVLSQDITPAGVAAYGWQANVAAGKVSLGGYVPSVDARTQLSAFAKTTLVGATIDDETKVAAGAPRMDWVGAVKFAVSQLALLANGNVAIAVNSYSVSGEAKDAKSYSAILDQTAHPLPAGLVLQTASVLPPRVTPYQFNAERRSGGVVLSGYVTSDGDRQAILAAARRVASGGVVTDNLAFASGAPNGFVTAATADVLALTRLRGGKVAMTDLSVTISGATYQEAAVGDIQSTLRDALPAGFTVADGGVLAAEIGQPLTAAACRDQLQAVLKTGGIEFDANNPVVTSDSLGALDRVAGTMLRCPTATVEVGVYSDNDGSAATALRDRTQGRADAILDYLAGAGVQRERLTAVGYGAAKPIGDNSTPAGRAANRRVEFTVAVPAGG